MGKQNSEILAYLFAHAEQEYGDFNCRIVHTVPKEAVIGVRTPLLRQYAKQLQGTEAAGELLSTLPHTYFEENQLHAFIISATKDFTTCIAQVEALLPYIDNWATCDQLSPRCFARHKAELLQHINRWLASTAPYTIRFGIKMLMDHFLDADFKPAYLTQVASIRSEHYYVRMMQAWYFATALAKQYDAALPYVTTAGTLEEWTRRKAIQKARESYRITPEQKQELKSANFPT